MFRNLGLVALVLVFGVVLTGSALVSADVYFCEDNNGQAAAGGGAAMGMVTLLVVFIATVVSGVVAIAGQFAHPRLTLAKTALVLLFFPIAASVYSGARAYTQCVKGSYKVGAQQAAPRDALSLRSRVPSLAALVRRA